MAQFYHPELGGNGQWMRGGMTMVGDMFNYGLQGTVSGICAELSNFTASHQAYVPLPPTPQAQGQFQGSGFGNFGSYNWWPGDLGSPSSSGGQNDSRYAYFPQARRLAVQRGGQVTVYDTLDHQIGGVQQQQGGPYGSQYFHEPVRYLHGRQLAGRQWRLSTGAGPFRAQPSANAVRSQRRQLEHGQ